MINLRPNWVRLSAGALSLTLFAVLLLVACAPQNSANNQATTTPIPTYDGPLDPEPITAPHFESLTYGIQAFLYWDYWARYYNLELIQEMGFTHIKQMITWMDINPFPDAWDWTWADPMMKDIGEAGLQVVARLDHPPEWATVDPATREDGVPYDVEAFAEFCGAVAERYHDQIDGYQVWNEPNLNREWGGRPPDAAGYVTLLGACYEAIKAADPDAIVISAGLAPTGTDDPATVIPEERYLQQMYDAGLADVYDVLGVHAPGYNNPPWVSTDEIAAANDGHRWLAFRHVEDMRRIQIANGDAHKQVAILEFGWHTNPGVHPDYAWFAVDEETQAEYLVAAYEYAAENWRPWVGLMSAIYMAAPEWTEADEQYWWSITIPDYGPKLRPAYFALADMPKYTGDRVIPGRESEEADIVSPDAGS